LLVLYLYFFFNDTATTEIYTLSLHDALPISCKMSWLSMRTCTACMRSSFTDRKSTRLNSSHVKISYAVFCLKKKNKTTHKRHAKSRAGVVSPLKISNMHR